MCDEKPLVVVVDDDADMLDIYRRVLENGGYRVQAFADVDDAIEWLKTTVPSLLITDVMMKAVDSGFALSRAIKTDARLSRVPVVVATAISAQKGIDFRPTSPEDLAEMHADAFFPKPIQASSLLATVEQLVGHQRERS